jgi:hypothetical protein
MALKKHLSVYLSWTIEWEDIVLFLSENLSERFYLGFGISTSFSQAGVKMIKNAFELSLNFHGKFNRIPSRYLTRDSFVL